jgi:hypothetical protein
MEQCYRGRAQGAAGAAPENPQGWPRIWADAKALVGIFSQTAGPICECWVTPVGSTVQVEGSSSRVTDIDAWNDAAFPRFRRSVAHRRECELAPGEVRRGLRRGGLRRRPRTPAPPGPAACRNDLLIPVGCLAGLPSPPVIYITRGNTILVSLLPALVTEGSQRVPSVMAMAKPRPPSCRCCISRRSGSTT